MHAQKIDSGLDCQGFIANTCSVNSIQADFILVVDSVIDALITTCPDHIHSIYLYGSVPRGNAVVGKSDLDVSIVFKQPLTASKLAELAAISRSIPQSYPEISKLDIDPGHVAEVLDPTERYRWQFWLKHCCCCVWGVDLSIEFEKCRPNAHISYQMNQDLATFLQDMEEKFSLMSPDDVGKVLGKKILRTAYLLVADQDSSWYTDLTNCANVCLEYYPDDHEHIQLALDLALGKLGARDKGIALFNGFGKKLARLLGEESDSLRSR